MRPLLLWLALLFVSVPAAAHLTPNSELRLDFGQSAVQAELIIPLPELSYALRRPVPAGLGAVQDDGLRRYVEARLRVPGWTVTLTDLSIIQVAGPPDLRARFTLTPPAGHSSRAFELRYSAVIDRVPDHVVLVVARNDFAGGQLSAEPELLGALRNGASTLRIDRGQGSDWRGSAAAIGLGMHHIAEGHDHLLFLIALLIPAPLLAAGGRWHGYAGLKPTAHRLAAVVTAFTIGHSLTLIGGAFLGWTLPAQPVEVGIALSILISAVHAWRPIFPGREAWIAGLFGLIHGLAFATLVSHLGMEPADKAKAILGFNVGIELIQLAVVAATMPALILLAQTPWYRFVRTGGAALAGVAALAWLVERLFQVDNPVAGAIDSALTHAPWLLLALTAAALILARPPLGQFIRAGR